MAIDENSKVWDGVFATFAEAAPDGTVFEEAIWLDKIAERCRQLSNASGENDAVAPVAVTRDYALPFVAACAAPHAGPLRILDFGGGMGTTFLPLVKMLAPDQPIDFVIVENAAVCSAGRDFFKHDSRITFREQVPGADEYFDIVHCGSSLHYVDDWEAMLDKLAALRPEYLLFADLPAAENPSFVTSQIFHGKSIPVHFWNFREFVAAVEARGFTLAFRSRYQGYYLPQNATPPVANFDAAHRLRYFCQLIFRRTNPDLDAPTN